jgi:ActR/RegA family two-component response regulator
MLDLDRPSSFHPKLKLVKTYENFKETSKHQKTRRALLLEDDDFDAAITTELLSHRISPTFKVTRALRMREAIECVSQSHYDVALLDLNLSDSSGLMTIREIIRANPSLPIVVLTGDNRKETAIEAIKIGAHEYLPKDQLNDRTLDRTIAFAALRHEAQAQSANRKSIDSLTGLPSFKSALTEYRYMAKRAIKTGQNIGFLLVDVKNFSRINHTYGQYFENHSSCNKSSFNFDTVRG